MGRIEGQFGGVYRRCQCRKRGVRERDCRHPWYYRLRHGGEERRESVGPGAEGKKIALQKLRDFQGRIMREEHLGVRTLGHATLEEFWPRVEAEFGSRRTPETWRKFRARYLVAQAFFSERIDAIGEGRIRAFLRFLGTRRGKPVKAATRNRWVDLLSVVLGFAVAEGYAAENHAAALGHEPEERQAPPRVTRRDMEAIAARAAPALRPLVRLAFDTGLRRGELLALQAADVDLAAGVLVVRRALSAGEESRPKSGRSRPVALNAPAAAVLRGLLSGRTRKLRGPERLFPDLDPAWVSRGVSAAATAANRQGVTLHDLRAAFASGLLEAGVGASVVRDLLGHSSVAVTDRYSSGSPTEAMREAVRRLEGAQDRAQEAPSRRAPEGKRRRAQGS